MILPHRCPAGARSARPNEKAGNWVAICQVLQHGTGTYHRQQMRETQTVQKVPAK